jgi:hypothetical protein
MSEATATLVRPEKSIWESKKFWGTVIGGVCAVLSLLPFPWAKPVGLALAGLSAVFVGSTGLADVGKYAPPKVDADAILDLLKTMTPPADGPKGA